MKIERFAGHTFVFLFPVMFFCLTGWSGTPGLSTIQSFAEEKPYTAEEGPFALTSSDDTPAQGPAAENAVVQAEEGGIYLAVDGNQIPEERLQDNTVEYDELGSLIHYNNTDVGIMMGSSARRKQDYTEIKNELSWERREAKDDKKEAKDDGDMESYMEYASYDAIYSSAIKSYNDMLKKLDRHSANKNRLSLEKQLTNAAQSLMISYQSLTLQKENLIQMEHLYGQLYEETVAGNRAGTATAQDVLTALNNWNQAQVSLNSITDSEASVYGNLCLLLGIDEDSKPNLEKIPGFNLQLLNDINLEQDIESAIGNNTTLMNTRQTASDGTTSGINKKKRELSGQEEKLKTVMQDLYAKVQQAKTAYEAATAGYSGSQLVWNNVQKKYSMGMLSKSQYLQEELKYLQKKSNYESANLNLFQAYEIYEWAVRGIASLE